MVDVSAPYNVVDDFNRQVLHIEIDTSIRRVRIFVKLRINHELPQVLRTDSDSASLGEIFCELGEDGWYGDSLHPARQVEAKRLCRDVDSYLSGRVARSTSVYIARQYWRGDLPAGNRVQRGERSRWAW